MSTINNLDIATAPRTAAGLAQYTGYQLQKLAEKIGMMATPEAEAALLITNRPERAVLVAEGLTAWDKVHGTVAAPATQPVAAPVVRPVAVAPPAPGPVVKQPVAPGGSPAPAIGGRRPRTPAVTATPAAENQPAEPAAPCVTIDLKPVLDGIATNKASLQGLSKTVLDLQKQNELLRGKLDAVMFMLSQLGEQTMGISAQDFLNDAVDFAAKQGKA